MSRGEMIRPFTPNEKALREKWVRQYEEAKANAEREAARAAELHQLLQDLAAAFNGGETPVMMDAEGLWRVEEPTK